MHNVSKIVLCTTYLLPKYSEIDVLDFIITALPENIAVLSCERLVLKKVRLT